MIDTIFAQASAKGRAGVAVIRMSGPRARFALETLAGPVPAERRAALRAVRDAAGELIDEALVLWFPGPRSFTGEDVAEVHLHGGPAIGRAVFGVLGGMDGLRLAEPGEFTRRALINGRMDLAQVEGLGDLLVAETEAQRRQAMGLMRGALSARAMDWRAELVRCLAHMEASIDFADDDLPADVLDPVAADLPAVAADIAAALRGGRISERLREGFEVALVGVPNAGKSTLLNRLAGREAAITSAVAGTTRDVIEVRMDLGGLPVTLLDMAGLRGEGDEVERIGVARARERAAAADLRLFLVESVGEVGALGVEQRSGDVVVLGKADLRDGRAGLAVSGVTGAGVGALLAAVEAELAERVAGASGVAHERQARALSRAAAALGHAESALGDGRVEIAVAEVRGALRALDFLVGRVDVEAVLDLVFQSFCLGK